MDILLIHSEARVRDLIGFAIEQKFNSQVSKVPDLENALKNLEKKPKLIIYSYQEEKDDNFKKFLKTKKGTPSILITTDNPEDADNTLDSDICGCVSQIELLDTLCSKIESLVKDKKLDFKLNADDSEMDYCRIETSLLMAASPLKAGIFIRLNNSKFIKIFSEGDNFDAADLDRYLLKKKVEHFWLKKTDSGTFVSKYSAMLDDLLKADTIPIEKAVDITVKTTETIQELSGKLGFTPEVQQLVKKNMDIAVKAMKTAPGVRDLLAKFESEKDKYIPAHASLVAFVSCALSKDMTWGSEATFQKLTMAAFLHDLTLQNHNLAAIRDLKELSEKKGQFSPEEIKAFEQHPMAAAEMARSIPGIPADVDTVIMQHHEFGDGKGFPRKLSAAHISPLSSLFIIAHELVHGSVMKKVDFKVLIEELSAKYQSGNFKKVLKAINIEDL